LGNLLPSVFERNIASNKPVAVFEFTGADEKANRQTLATFCRLRRHDHRDVLARDDPLVRSRQADFAVTADGPGRPGLEARLLFREKFVVVCHRSHPLAQRPRLALADLDGCAYIRLVRTGSIAQYLESSLRSVNLIDTGLEVDQVATVAGLVASNLGISIVPELTIPYFDGKHVVAVPLTSSDLNRPIYLVWPVARTLSKAAREFVGLLDDSELPMQAKVRSRKST
jgi:DNA-binding transcriptional LysR family regulator